MKYKYLLILVLWNFSICVAQEMRNSFSYESKIDFDEKIVYVENFDSIQGFEKYVINGYTSRIPFYHYFNKGNKNKYVILLHGLGGSKETWIFDPYESLPMLKDSLFRLGFNLIIPDAQFHGERSYELDFRPAGRLVPSISKNEKDSQKISELVINTTKDIRIIMDFFQKRSPEEEIEFHVVGYSMGASISLLLNASDERITSVVACVAPLNRPISEIKDFNWGSKITNDLKDITAMYYSEFQKAPIALLMGKDDFLTSESEATQFYSDLKQGENYLKFYDSGHILPSAFIEQAVHWINTHNKK